MRKHPARIFSKHAQQFVFNRRKVNFPAADIGTARRIINAQLTVVINGRLLRRGIAFNSAAAQCGTQARQKFINAERFG